MLRRFVTAALLVLASLSLIIVGGQATAGGPTSVLLTNPGEEKATALYYTDERYAMLEKLLHGTNTTRGTSAEGPPGEGTYFSITWLIHDIEIWRTDQLVLDVSGSPWISTQNKYGQGVAAQGVKWHSLKDGDAIVDLMTSLGLTGDATSAPTTNTASDTASDLVAAPTSSTTNEGIPGWVWIVPGVVLGVAASWAVTEWRVRTKVQTV